MLFNHFSKICTIPCFPANFSSPCFVLYGYNCKKTPHPDSIFTMHMTSWVYTNDFINGPSMIDSLSILFFYKFYRPVLIHLLSCFRIPNVLKNIVHWAILHFNNNRRLIYVFLFLLYITV